MEFQAQQPCIVSRGGARVLPNNARGSGMPVVAAEA